MATYKQIEQARETRLWIGQIVVPAVTAIVLLAANPDVREWTKDKFCKIKQKFSKSKKEES